MTAPEAPEGWGRANPIRARILLAAAAAEMGTGLGLLFAPTLVAQLLLGETLVGVAVAMARVAGLALIGLGIACWPGSARLGMLTYSTTAVLYLAFLGTTGEASGPLLWPAVLFHAAVAAVLASGNATNRGGADRRRELDGIK